MYKSDEEYVTEMVNNGYFSKYYEPIKCIMCDSIKYHDKVIDRDEISILEQQRICNDCGYSFGYWLTGNWIVF